MDANKLSNIEEKIRKGLITEAEFDLQDFSAKTNVEFRYKNHLIGKTYFFKGKYLEAAKHYENTIKIFGPHINLLCDLVYSYTLNGNYSKAYQAFQQIKIEFPKALPFLKPNTIAKTYLCLGRISFEIMEFKEAFHYFQTLISYNDMELHFDKQIDPYFVDLAKIELLKGMSFLNLPLSQWSALYGQISLMNYQEPKLIFLQHHALLIADARHDSLNKSQLRLLEFQKKGIIHEDILIGLGELIELSLIERGLSKTQTDIYNVSLFLKTKARDQYESSIQRILSSQIITVETIIFCLSEINQLNPIDQFRLLNILLAITSNSNSNSNSQTNNVINNLKVNNDYNLDTNHNSLYEYHLELRKRREMIIQSLSPENKTIINHFLKINLNHCNTTLQSNILIKKFENTLLINGIKKEISTNDLINFLFSSLQDQNFIPIEVITKAVWNAEFNESYYKRIWIAVKRLNSALKTSLNGENLFATRKEGVYLTKQFKLIVKNTLQRESL